MPSLYLLPELLAAYHEKTPEIRFRTSCSDSLDVINKVADSTCDIGLVGTKTAEANCEFLPVASDELVIAAPNTPHFRAYQGQPDPLTALLREPFLLREDNSGTKQETLYFLQNHGLSLDELNVIAVMDDAAVSSGASHWAWAFPFCRAQLCRPMHSRDGCCCSPSDSQRSCAGCTLCIRPYDICPSRLFTFWIL